jgi:hypothetical protein
MVGIVRMVMMNYNSMNDRDGRIGRACTLQ